MQYCPKNNRLIIGFILFLAWVIVIPCSSGYGESASTDASQDSPQAVFNLEEIVVTGTKTPHTLKETPVHTTVITDEDIDDQSVQSVSDILKSVPGFYTSAEDMPGETAWRMTIRGLDFNNGYGLVLINGQRIKGEGMGEYGYGVNQIPPSLIEKIEITKGPSSVLYGSDALAGVVNIITKPCPEDPIFGMTAAIGSEDTRSGSVYAGTKKGKLSTLFTASVDEADAGAYGTNSTRDEEYTATRIDTRLKYEPIENIQLNLKLAMEDRDRLRIYKTKDVMRHDWFTKYRVAPGITATIDDTSSIHINGYYYTWEMNRQESGVDSSGYSATIGDMTYQDVETRYSKTFKDDYQMTLGAEFLQEELDYNYADEIIETYSGYAQIDGDLLSELTLVLGIRIDDHSEFGTHTSPKLSFMYSPLEDTRIRGSVGRGFKSPTIRQMYYKELYQHGTYWYQSNPDLDPEKSTGYNLSLEQFFGQSVMVDISLFRNDIKDKVLQIDTDKEEDGLPIVSFKNVSRAHTQGVELGIKAILMKHLTATFAYTFTDTEDEDSGNELTYVPSSNTILGLAYTFLPWDMTLSMNAQYADEMYTDEANTDKTNDYLLLDAKLSKTFNRAYTVSMKGNNLTDTDYGQPDREWLGATWLLKFKMDI